MEATLKAKEDRFEESCEAEGRIRLGEAGWKARYYQEKMEAPPGAQDEVGAAAGPARVAGAARTRRGRGLRTPSVASLGWGREGGEGGGWEDALLLGGDVGAPRGAGRRWAPLPARPRSPPGLHRAPARFVSRALRTAV